MSQFSFHFTCIQTEMEDISALEERCMRIVAAADAQAKESRRELEQEVQRLRAELTEKEETYQIHMEQVNANMRLHYRNLQEMTNQFVVAHRESSDLIQATAVEREEIETRALTHLKLTMHQFARYWAWKRSKEQRASIFSFAKHFTRSSKALIAKLKVSPLKEIQQAVRGGYTSIVEDSTNEIHESVFDDMEEYLRDEVHRESPSVVDMSKLVEDLIENSGHVGRAAAAIMLPHTENRTTTASGSAHAVVLYLLGAADVLDRFGDKISGCVVEFVDAIEHTRKAFLLHEERELLRQHAQSTVGVANVEVSALPVQLLLTEKITAAAHDRMTTITNLLNHQFRSTNSALSESIRTVRQELWDAVVPSLVNGLFMNETQFRSQLINSATRETHHTSRESAPAPPVVVSALYRAATSSSGLVDKIMIHVHEEQQKTLRRVHTEMALQMDKVVKTANTQRNIVVEQHTAEMRIDDIRADIRHQQFMRSLTIERETKLAAKLERETSDHRAEIERLRIVLDKLQQENDSIKQRCAMAEAETTLLREVAAHRQRSSGTLTVVQEETKMVNYAVNQGTFGETWQESLLRLRERILSELSSDNARFLAKLRSFLKRKEVDHAQIEELYEARLHATVSKLNEEHESQTQWLRKRCEMEIATLIDNQATIVTSMQDEWAREKQKIQQRYEDSYLARVDEMNHCYAQRLRQSANREKEWEDRLAIAQRRLREQFRARENELERKFSERQSEMRQIFEDDSLRVKEQFALRHKERTVCLAPQRARSHLQATARFDSDLNERSQVMQKKFEVLSTRLQEDVLRFVGEKQSFFDAFRANELELMASFMHKKESMTAAKYENILETQRIRDAEEVQAIRTDHDSAIQAERRIHEASSMQISAEVEKRLAKKSMTADHTFQTAQQIQLKNDDAFWNRCRQYLVQGEEALVNRQANVEIEMTRRYQTLVDQCQTYLSHDISNARENLNREISMRYDAIHESCKPLQRSATQMQYDLWEEHHRRSFITGQEAAEWAYICSMCEESLAFRKRRAFFNELHESNVGLSFSQVSVEDVRSLREKFDQRLAEEHSYVANLTRDTMSTLEVGLEASHSAAVHFQEAQQQQLSDVCRLLQQKHEAFNYQRTKLIQDKCSSMLEVFSLPLQHVSFSPQPPHATEHEVPQSNYEFVQAAAEHAKQWETKINGIEITARKRQREAFNTMHEEYIATTTTLMAKLELSHANVEELKRLSEASNARSEAQQLELSKALSLAGIANVPPSTTTTTHQIDIARQLAASRETFYTSDFQNHP
ncbi:Hypothetical protein, putative [Bodo saltans]|uniref:Uncharacterized protein n=1 Tax=Bodo saltans TaxID=75058 RepID=A0A0S4J3R1_BODSA|nr:Hypothetical protein, putative [Bodo saltans]|eukprot:CUG61072.1 Hypothetical protein, putative [Bodo saltans]